MPREAKGINVESKTIAAQPTAVFSRSQVQVPAKQQCHDIWQLEHHCERVPSDFPITSERFVEQRDWVIWLALNILTPAVQRAVTMPDRSEWEGADIRPERLHWTLRQGPKGRLQRGLSFEIGTRPRIEFIRWPIWRNEIDANEQHLDVLRERLVRLATAITASAGGPRSQTCEATVLATDEHPGWKEEIHSRSWLGWDFAPLRRGKLTIKFIL